MADLFDMKVGGLGFHLTAHMIALAALFVACFAITGYISFRDGSISENKLDGANFLTDGENMTSLTMGTIQEKWYLLDVAFPLASATVNDGSIGSFVTGLPAGCYVQQAFVDLTEAFAGDPGNLSIEETTTTLAAAGGADAGGTTVLAAVIDGATDQLTIPTLAPVRTRTTTTRNSFVITATAGVTLANQTAGKLSAGILVRGLPGVTLP